MIISSFAALTAYGGHGTLLGSWTGGFFPMFRLCSRVIALAVMLVGLPTAQAAEPQPMGRLTLACKGTAQADDTAKPEPVSIGIIIDFAAQTVEGFDSDANIVGIRGTVISFAGSLDEPSVNRHIHGTIDRVTGAMEAFYFESQTDAKKYSWRKIYSLKCNPTQRMF